MDTLTILFTLLDHLTPLGLAGLLALVLWREAGRRETSRGEQEPHAG